MSTHAALRSRLHRITALLPAARGWWLVLAAVLAGLLLFALMFPGKREQLDLPGAIDAVPGDADQAYRPLPAPLAAPEAVASGMHNQAAAGGEVLRIDRHADAPAPPPGMLDPSAAPEDTPITPVPGDPGVPRLLSAPTPDYPRAALRNRLSGNVVLQIEVRANGRVGAVSVAESSGHRTLDRAAARAVRRWRFEPARRDGRPVAASVQQVIRFDAPR